MLSLCCGGLQNQIGICKKHSWHFKNHSAVWKPISPGFWLRMETILKKVVGTYSIDASGTVRQLGPMEVNNPFGQIEFRLHMPGQNCPLVTNILNSSKPPLWPPVKSHPVITGSWKYMYGLQKKHEASGGTSQCQWRRWPILGNYNLCYDQTITL